MNENFPEPGADGAAEAAAPLEPVTTPEPAAAATPADALSAVGEGVPSDGDAVPVEPPTGALDPAPVPVPVLEPVRPLADDGAPAGSTRKQNRIALVATVALVVMIAFGGGFATGRLSAPPAPGEGTAVATAPPGAPEASAEGSGEPAATAGTAVTPVPSTGPDLPSDGPRLGNADAPVVIDYWADYQCPFCSKFAQETIPALLPYIEDGTVQLVHRDFAFIGPESMQASIAVRCADREDKYWWMHDAVYAAQDGENEGAFADEKLIEIAGSIGLDTEAFAACLTDHKVLVEVLDDTAAGHRVGIESTPTVDINGVRLLGVPDPAKIQDAIAAAVAGATPAPLPTQAPTDDPWAALDLGGREAGSSTAPVTVELWMDYQSTDAPAIAQALEPELRKRAEAGGIRVVQKDLALLGEESVTASAAIRCIADQDGPAWLLHDILAVNAQGADSGIYVTDTMLRVASQLGLDVVAFDACLASPGTAEAVQAETAAGVALGLEAGPAVIVRQGDTEVARFTGAVDPTAVLEAIDGIKE